MSPGRIGAEGDRLKSKEETQGAQTAIALLTLKSTTDQEQFEALVAELLATDPIGLAYTVEQLTHMVLDQIVEIALEGGAETPDEVQDVIEMTLVAWGARAVEETAE